jgi:serine/threonine protein kinase
MDNRIGQRLGNYRLTRLLGQGSFADVYLGEHIHLDTHQVAIKVLCSQVTGEDAQRFHAEARILAGLAHPHIVRLLDYAIEGNTPYVIMEYVPKGTLRQRFPKGVKLPLTTIVPYVIQIAGALQYAHHRKLIHRDIKPANLLLGRHNEVLLSDFGIAILTRSARSQSLEHLAGTFAYMAPEQLQGKSRRASDQYALGIVVYEWLSGDVPFHGTSGQLTYQHIYTPPQSLREKLHALSQAVEKVVMKALAKEPEERYASVLEFAQAMDTALKRDIQAASEPTIKDEPIELDKTPRINSIPVPEPLPVPHRTKEELMRKGLTLYNAKHYKDAIIAFSYAIKVAPAYAPAYARRGQVYAYLKEYEKAIRDFDQALELDPQLAWVAIDREQAYHQLKKKIKS